ncbi:hypothetical protein CULC809_00054 [Corynebacterium ulcerans 809]|nr:hypothetical protein CULC809_00054 [Corynebacterium ulcerans 809]
MESMKVNSKETHQNDGTYKQNPASYQHVSFSRSWHFFDQPNTAQWAQGRKNHAEWPFRRDLHPLVRAVVILMSAVIEIKHLGVKLGTTRAVHNVDLSFHRGEIHSLLGPNGAGKTTILKAILGAVDYTGTITGHPELLRTGHLIEYPAFYSRLSLLDNLKLHADYQGSPHDELKDLLSLVGLSSHHSVFCEHASLGMKQRLGIARALVGNPQLLLLDEPTNGLDPIGIRDCRELLRRLRDERNLAIVVSSHNLTEILATADQLTFIRSGEIIRSLPRSSVSEQGLEELYVELIQGDRQ